MSHQEEWRKIDGAPLYSVSNLGRVMSYVGPIPRILGGSIVEGYARHKLGGLLGKGTVSTHELVLTAFVGPRPEGMEGLHGDDVKSNNALSNLRWGSRSENLHDSVRNGRHASTRMTACKRGHDLTADNIYVTKKSNGTTARQCLKCKRANHAAAARVRRAEGRA